MNYEIDPNDPYEIKVWAQMFFDDGSVSRGIRVPADAVFPDEANYQQMVDSTRIKISITRQLLNETNRDAGLILFWGNGCLDCKEINQENLKALEDIVNAVEVLKKSI